MYNNKHFTAIVLAAGRGSRMKSDIPKQFMMVAGEKVIYYSLKAFQDSDVDRIILVTGKDYISFCKKDIVEKYAFDKVTDVIAGGDERYLSVKNGLELAAGTDYVMIHDGARPCIDQDMIRRSMDEVIKCGACTVGVPAKDTIKVVDKDNFGIDTPDRNTLWQVQTPQSFMYNDLINAYELMQKDSSTMITDDTMIMEKYLNKKSRLIMGDYRNIKITTPEDILIAELLLKNSRKCCKI